MHLDHDIFFDFRCCNDQGLVLCNMQLEHAFPKETVAFPLQYNGNHSERTRKENPDVEIMKILKLHRT